MNKDTASVRRANLKQWIEKYGTPPAEKSYFSQLINGASFGEKAARRIERDYKMGEGYLDRPLVLEGESTAKHEVPPPERMELSWVTYRELRLLTQFREATERGKETIDMAAEVAEKSAPVALRRNNA